MSEQAHVTANTDGGFWKLSHEDLAAVLARHDLSGEQLRVYLALADLTRGYGREQDVVSLSQIAERAGNMRRPHVVRALHGLAEQGLYSQAPAKGQAVLRRVAWPPPPVSTAATVPALGTTAVPGTGNTPVPAGGNTTVPIAVPKAVPSLGNHQDTKTTKKRKEAAAGDSDVVWNDGESRFEVAPELMATWTRDYPHLDVAQEIRKAGQWHATNRKWRSSFRKALVSWLNRARPTSASSEPAKNPRLHMKTPSTTNPDAGVTDFGKES